MSARPTESPRGFDYLTGEPGERLHMPTKYDRRIAERLRSLDAVRRVTWYSITRKIKVATVRDFDKSDIREVLDKIPELDDDRPADLVPKNADYSDGEILLEIER